MDFIEDEAFISELEIFGVESVPPDCLQKLRELCAVYGQTADVVTSTWVAFTFKKNIAVPDITLQLLEQMERDELTRSTSKALAKTPVSKKSAPRIFTATDCDAEDGILESYGASNKVRKQCQRTPDVPRTRHVNGSSSNNTSALFSPASFSPKCLNSAAKYSSRSTKGDVAAHLRNHEDLSWKCTNDSIITVTLKHRGSVTKGKWSYMFENLRERAGALSDTAVTFADQFRKEMDEENSFVDIRSLFMDDSFVTGRVLCDSSGKINANSLILEGSESSYGHSVQLNVSSLQRFSLFPGQVIVGKGVNPSGRTLVLKELCEGKMLPFPEEPPQLDGPLHIVVASGPYTTSDTLSFEPMSDLATYLAEHEPHVCIMVGPFVDCKHELIQRGNLPDLYETIFQKQIDVLASILERTRTQVILVPSYRDVHHDFVYPTPPFKLEKQHKRFHCFPDPSLININGLVVGVTGVDTLLHLGKEEMSFPPGSSDRLSRLAKHILTQQCFYPLYPPSEEVNIDFSLLEDSGCLSVTPHLLILPSDLRSFVKEVNGCVCVNPEHLTKGMVGGSFARILVTPVDKDTHTGSVLRNTSVEVVKI